MTRSLSRRICLFALALCVLGGCLYAREDGARPLPAGFLVIGHRGAPLDQAENTLASFDEALRQGANALEIDLCLTADGQVVLWHDAQPDELVALVRQAGGEQLLYRPVVPPPASADHRPVRRLSLERMLATHGYARGRNEALVRPATLTELARWLPPPARLAALIFDLKTGSSDDAREIATAVSRNLAPDEHRRIYLLSPNLSVVATLRDVVTKIGRRDCRVMVDFLASGAPRKAVELGWRDIALGNTPTRINHAFLEDLEQVMTMREDGSLDTVIVWTVSGRVDLDLLLSYGADGIITNTPADLIDRINHPGPLQRRPDEYPIYAPWHRWRR